MPRPGLDGSRRGSRSSADGQPKMTDHPVILALRTERSSWAATRSGNAGSVSAGRDLQHPHDRLFCSPGMPPRQLVSTPTGEHVDDDLVTTRPVRDFDFHAGEDAARVFTSAPDGVLRLTAAVSVTAAR